MNAFFIFCKRHRDVVRGRYPHLENRSITKILGEWWAALDPEEKARYTALARQYKEAFMKANPNFKWYSMPPSGSTRPHTRPSNHQTQSSTPSVESNEPTPVIQTVAPPVSSSSSVPNSSKPPKKRYLENGEFKSPSNETTPSESPAEACSALMELAEMCTNKEMERHHSTIGTQSSTTTTTTSSIPSTASTTSALHSATTSNNSNKRQFSAMPVFDVDAANLVIDRAFSLPSPPRPSAQEHPLNLCKETTITGSNQQLINHLVVKFMAGSESSQPHPFPPFNLFSSNQRKSPTPSNDAATQRSSPPSNECSPSNREESPSDQRKPQRSCKGKRYKALMSEGLLQPAKERRTTWRKPNEDKPDDAVLEDLNKSPSLKKSVQKRSPENVGAKNEDSNKGNGKTGPFDLEEQLASLPLCSLEAFDHKRRLPGEHKSDASPSSPETNKKGISPRKRFKTGDFDLEAQIAALPPCDMDSFNKKPQASGDRSGNSSSSNAVHQQGIENNDHLSENNSPQNQDSDSGTDIEVTATPTSAPAAATLVGSRKRKARSKSITHLNLTASEPTGGGLATLADLALQNK